MRAFGSGIGSLMVAPVYHEPATVIERTCFGGHRANGAHHRPR
jgi:hypothetical protein